MEPQQNKLASINQQVVDLINTRSEVRLTADELQYLLLIEFNNQQIRQKQYYAFYLSCPVPQIHNAKVLGIIVAAVVGIFLAPVLGIGVATAALIGASIGWRLLGGASDNKPKVKEAKNATIVSTPGFDSAPQPPVIGSVIPLLFTSILNNPNGGLRVSGNVVNSYITTFKNVQTLSTLIAVGLGEIGDINNSQLLIDNQARSSFLQTTIKTNQVNGLETQGTFNEYQKYSQVISPSNNATLGISLRGKFISGTLVNNSFDVEKDDYEALVAGESYRLENGKEFKIINKFIQGSNYKIITNTELTSPPIANTSNKIFAFYQFRHKTNQSCSAIELHFALDISARQKTDNEPTTYAVVFDLYVNHDFIGIFSVTSKAEGTLRRSILIYDLPYQKHLVHTYPRTSVDTSMLPIYRLDDSGVTKQLNKNLNYNGILVKFKIESDDRNYPSISQLNEYLTFDNKSVTSSDRGANTRVTAINYFTSPLDLGHPRISNYKNVVLNSITVEASSGLTNSPSYSILVNEGIKGNNHIAAGKASIGSQNNQLVANGVDLSEVQIGMICRSITNQIQSPITSISNGVVTVKESLYWTPGDDFLIYSYSSINYFPDVFVYSRLNRKGGVKGLIISEKFIDFPSICKARRFCKNNNYFFDAVIDSPTKWNEWVTRESLASMLYPFKYAGNYGLKIEENSDPTDIFNASRIIPGSYSQTKPSAPYINAVQLTYTANDDTSDNSFFKVDRTLTVMTAAAFYSTEPIQIDNLVYKSITNLAQAKAVASKYLKSRLLQNKVIEFKTGVYGFNCREGDLIIVQYALTELESEMSGFCLQADTLVNGNQEILLNKKATETLNNQGYVCSIYHLETGTVQTAKNFLVLPTGRLSISGLSEVIKPAREGYNGDVIVINKNISEKIYRISAIKPENYEVKITAVNWDASIHDDSDLFYVN
jgi:hypothetical protein